MTEIINHGKVKRLFKGSNFNFGYYAFIDRNGQFVIGEERGREGGELYRGEYNGENTPWLNSVKKENIKFISLENKEHNPHYTLDAVNYKKEFYQKFKDAKKALGWPEEDEVS